MAVKEADITTTGAGFEIVGRSLREDDLRSIVGLGEPSGPNLGRFGPLGRSGLCNQAGGEDNGLLSSGLRVGGGSSEVVGSVPKNWLGPK